MTSGKTTNFEKKLNLQLFEKWVENYPFSVLFVTKIFFFKLLVNLYLSYMFSLASVHSKKF